MKMERIVHPSYAANGNIYDFSHQHIVEKYELISAGCLHSKKKKNTSTV